MKKFLLVIILFLFFPFFISAQQVDINAASLTQLDELTGIGPTYAQRIIDGRPYSSLNELTNVKGIGPITLQKIKDQGLACVNCTSIEAPPIDQDPQDIDDKKYPDQENTSDNSQNNITYPKGVYINEVLPNPEGPDETDEWIEIYNSNNFDVNLSGWNIKDENGKINSFVIKNNILPAYGFIILTRPITKIMLNNDTDTLYLYNPIGEILNSISYSKAPLGQSFNLRGNEWFWSSETTPGENNVIYNNNLSNKTNSVKKENEELELAYIGNSLDKISNIDQDNSDYNPWFLFLTVLTTTIISAIIIILIKLKIKGSEIELK